jgi:ribosome-associated protein
MNQSLQISSSLVIPASELAFKTSRSGGPGGQHVNTADTRVELSFDVAHSSALGPRQRARLLERLAHRLDSRGILHLSSSRYRSQGANRKEVLRRLQRLLREALRRRAPRIATQPTRASRVRRMEEKQRRARRKRDRRPVDPDQE